VFVALVVLAVVSQTGAVFAADMQGDFFLGVRILSNNARAGFLLWSTCFH